MAMILPSACTYMVVSPPPGLRDQHSTDKTGLAPSGSIAICFAVVPILPTFHVPPQHTER